MCEPGVTVAMLASQLGKTLCEILAVANWVANDPAPIGVLYPTDGRAKEWSKEKLDPIVEASPRLRGLIGSMSAASRGTAILRSFPGGFLALGGAQRASGVAQKTLERVIADEIDRMPYSTEKEGDPIMLFWRRTENFRNASMTLSGTPTVKGMSRIMDWMELSDWRKLFVLCRSRACAHQFFFDFSMVRWDNGTEDTRIVCPSCGYRHVDEERVGMVEEGIIKPTQLGRHRGFDINGLYSLFPGKIGYKNRLHQIAEEWLQVNKKPAERRVFINTVLNQATSDDVEKVDPEPIKGRREKYQAQIPDGVLLLICSVDVQDDRLEAEIIGYGEDEESWGIEYVVIRGSPKLPRVWELLTELLDKQWQHELGFTMKIAAAGVDSGGHATKEVHAYARKSFPRRVWAMKGSPTPNRPLVEESKKKRILLVGTDTAKETIYARINNSDPGPGYMHYPVQGRGDDRGYADDYFDQLTVEEVTVTYKEGKRIRKFICPKGKRNEALDIRVYSLAVLSALNPNWGAIKKSLARKRTEQAGSTPAIEAQPVGRKIRARRGGFIGGFR